VPVQVWHGSLINANGRRYFDACQVNDPHLSNVPVLREESPVFGSPMYAPPVLSFVLSTGTEEWGYWDITKEGCRCFLTSQGSSVPYHIRHPFHFGEEWIGIFFSLFNRNIFGYHILLLRSSRLLSSCLLLSPFRGAGRDLTVPPARRIAHPSFPMLPWAYQIFLTTLCRASLLLQQRFFYSL